ncbi:hypothetical protein J2780_003764 [Chryseobacterium camelliae]|nr:hypothetical protein [Chryseobacterium camelliae]
MKLNGWFTFTTTTGNEIMVRLESKITINKK